MFSVVIVRDLHFNVSLFPQLVTQEFTRYDSLVLGGAVTKLLEANYMYTFFDTQLVMPHPACHCKPRHPATGACTCTYALRQPQKVDSVLTCV